MIGRNEDPGLKNKRLQIRESVVSQRSSMYNRNNQAKIEENANEIDDNESIVRYDKFNKTNSSKKSIKIAIMPRNIKRRQ